MTLNHILDRVNGLSEGNDIVEVYIWDKTSLAVTMVGPKELQDRLNQLSTTEEVLGAITTAVLMLPDVRISPLTLKA